MGRNTHLAADRPDRRRIVFSTTQQGWQRLTQLWLDPADVTPADLPDLVGEVHPLAKGLILGGTRVHDWFLDNDAIDQVNLTVEPVAFGMGLPIFSGQQATDPIEVFVTQGFTVQTEEQLNSAGTRYLVLAPLLNLALQEVSYRS